MADAGIPYEVYSKVPSVINSALTNAAISAISGGNPLTAGVIGGLSNALSSSLGIPPALANAASGYLANALGMQGAGKATLTNLGTSLISNLLSGSTSGSSAPSGYSGAASGASGIGGLGGTQTGTASAIPWLQAQKPTMLTIGSREKPSQEASLKQIYQGLDPALAQYYAERGISVPGISAASGGTVDSSIGNELDRKYSPNFKIYSPTILINRGLGQIPGSTMQPLKMLRQSIHGAAKGGLPRQYKDASPEGHNPEFITGLTGFYADGGGTGQSAGRHAGSGARSQCLARPRE